jgi:hypothetical protein
VATAVAVDVAVAVAVDLLDGQELGPVLLSVRCRWGRMSSMPGPAGDRGEGSRVDLHSRDGHKYPSKLRSFDGSCGHLGEIITATIRTLGNDR